MSGEELKPFLLHLDESLANVARNLGVSPTNFSKTLKTKDIKSGLLEQLSKIYNVPVSYFYENVVDNPKINVDGNSIAAINGIASVTLHDTLAPEKIKYLEAIIVEKDARIQELKECLEILKNR